MKANELRFNNWVMDGFGNPFQIRDIISENNTSGYKLSTLQPIPLTPEILELAGFEYRAGGGISGADMWQGLGFWSIEYCDWIRFRGNFRRSVPITLILEGYFNSRVEYLHQLQNLYHSLCGHELEIKIK